MTGPSGILVDKEVLAELVQAAANGVVYWGEGNEAKMRLEQSLKRLQASIGWQPEPVVRPEHMDVDKLQQVQTEAGYLRKAKHGLALLAGPGHGSHLRNAVLKLHGTPSRDHEDQSNEVEVTLDYEWAQDILLMKIHKHRGHLAGLGVKS